MSNSTDRVQALARAYFLTEIFPLDHAQVREAVMKVVEQDVEEFTFRVAAPRLLVDDAPVPDPQGMVRELARDLEIPGVRSVSLPAALDSGEIRRFLSAVRAGADSGDGGGSAGHLREELEGIVLEFGEAERRQAGLGRSIDTLFAEAAPPETESEVAGSEVGEPGSGVGEPEPSPDGEPSLDERVRRFLEAEGEEREEVAGRIRERAGELSQAASFEEVVDGTLLLAEEGCGDPSDPEALSLARELAVPGVCARIAIRLGEVREEEARERALHRISHLGPEMARAISEALAEADDRSARRTLIEGMVRLGEDAREVVEEMVEDSRWFVVRNAVIILGDVAGERAIEHLTSTLGHEDPRVRRESVLALARVGGEDAGMLVVGMVEDPSPEVRAAAALALGSLEMQRAVKPLLNRLKEEEDQDVEIQIIRALGRLGDPGAVQQVEKRAVPSFFSRPPTELRIAAYRALHSIGTPHARELLEEAREDGDEEIRNAVEALLDSSPD